MFKFTVGQRVTRERDLFGVVIGRLVSLGVNYYEVQYDPATVSQFDIGPVELYMEDLLQPEPERPDITETRTEHLAWIAKELQLPEGVEVLPYLWQLVLDRRNGLKTQEQFLQAIAEELALSPDVPAMVQLRNLADDNDRLRKEVAELRGDGRKRVVVLPANRVDEEGNVLYDNDDTTFVFPLPMDREHVVTEIAGKLVRVVYEILDKPEPSLAECWAMIRDYNGYVTLEEQRALEAVEIAAHACDDIRSVFVRWKDYKNGRPQWVLAALDAFFSGDGE